MAVFKQFNTNEVVITPFSANKRFHFSSSQVSASDVGIEYYQGLQGPYTSGSNPTGFTSVLDKVLVFNSVILIILDFLYYLSQKNKIHY